MKIVNPIVNLIDYGPKQLLMEGDRIKGIVTPDEIVAAAAGVTYKDTKFFTEALQRRINGDFGNVSQEDYRKDLMGLVNSAGQGHASLATTPYMWVSVEGEASKMVDSLFTGAKFGSFLMPSSRRIPIEKSAIVVPRGIEERGKNAIDLYMQISEGNIDLYERLQTMNVPKEEAAKIVQYGHLGGGFLSFPLETLVGLRRQFDSNGDATPREGLEIINQLEDIVREKGMSICYTARLLSPREACPNPDIFHHRRTEAATYSPSKEMLLISENCNISDDFKFRISEFKKKVEECYSTEEGIKANWREVSGELQKICADFPSAIDIKLHSSIPWRVWGEVKRHRTLPQSAESIYNAAERAIGAINVYNSGKRNISDLGEVVSFRSCISDNPEVSQLWINQFTSAMKAYSTLTRDMRVQPADALYLVPRGLKLRTIKKLDTWNALQGYTPLRLCNTAEGEMREITEKETEIMQQTLPLGIGEVISPKCQTTGHCHDGMKGKHCGKITKAIPFYGSAFDKEIKAERKAAILGRIDNKTQ